MTKIGLALIIKILSIIRIFMEIIVMVTRQCYADDSDIEDIKRLQDMHTTLLELKEDPIPLPITVELLDPNGHSQILHGDATMRELDAEELEDLPVGPEAPVFSQSDME